MLASLMVLIGAGCPPVEPSTVVEIKTEAAMEKKSEAGPAQDKIEKKSGEMVKGDVFVMKDGKMMVEMKTGSKALMEKDMTMADGTKVMTDGKVVMKNDQTTMMKEGDMLVMKGETATIVAESTPEDTAALARSGYQPYEEGDQPIYAPDAKVVLYFNASWCPTCRAIDADIRANASSIPENVTILKLNYDTATSLKAKHGVTYQHTFVQIDPVTGEQIKKWSGGLKLGEVLARIE